MSKLKIEHGVSKTERVKLQVSIDQTISEDIELMAKWSDNEKHYIVNELLRFALGESAEFQQHKQSLASASQTKQQIIVAVESKAATRMPSSQASTPGAVR